jgi:hypothetical protein
VITQVTHNLIASTLSLGTAFLHEHDHEPFVSIHCDVTEELGWWSSGREWQQLSRRRFASLVRCLASPVQYLNL